MGRCIVPAAVARGDLGRVLCALPAGLLSVLASRRNDAVQDVVIGTAVIDDWVYRTADG